MKRLYQATRRAPDAERCDLCAAPLELRHDHLFEVRRRAVRCACHGCALIIPTSETAAYRLVPRRFERVQLEPKRWIALLGVPVGICAVILHDDGRAMVGYPGPAGLVESELDPAAWGELQRELPAMLPEIEALVCSSLPGGGAWLCGIDVVFEMISELRAHWRGLAGGPEAPAALARMLGGRA